MRGIKISLHPFFAAGLFLLLFAMPRERAFAAFSSVLLHELGHGAAALLLGKKIRSVKIMPVGISLGLSAPASYGEEIFIAAAGPFMNLLYVAGAKMLLPPSAFEAVLLFSLSLGVLNLLPMQTLDGGRIAYAVAAYFFGEDTAGRVTDGAGAVCFGVLFVLSLYLLFYTGVNFALLLFCGWFFSYQLVKKQGKGVANGREI